MATYRSQIRKRLLSGETIVASKLAAELGCTEATVHQVMAALRNDDGYQFRREAIPSRGKPYRYTLVPKQSRKLSLEERIARIERILAHHQLRGPMIDSALS